MSFFGTQVASWVCQMADKQWKSEQRSFLLEYVRKSQPQREVHGGPEAWGTTCYVARLPLIRSQYVVQLQNIWF